jgi:hypothetical protein
MLIGPYSQDLLTRIYNVSWGELGGLAVEFGDKAEGPPPAPAPARRPQIKKPG